MSETAVVYGLHAVRVLLERHPERVRQLWLQQGREDARATGLRALALERRVRVGARPTAELERMAGEGVHQGVVAEVEPSPPQTEDDLEDLVLAAGRDVLLLVLDGVQDPHNLGACLRTAEAAGVDLVIICKDHSAGITPVVRRAASGAAEVLPIIQATNLARVLRALKKRGIWLTGTSDEAANSLYAQDLGGPLALVMGSEGTGLRRLTAELCDYLVSIPMAGQVESLNVSVATGVCLYEINRQRISARLQK